MKIFKIKIIIQNRENGQHITGLSANIQNKIDLQIYPFTRGNIL